MGGLRPVPKLACQMLFQSLSDIDKRGMIEETDSACNCNAADGIAPEPSIADGRRGAIIAEPGIGAVARLYPT